MTEGHYAVRAEDFDRLVAERDEARAEAARLREGLDNAEGRARALLRDLVTCYNQADKARAQADRLREALQPFTKVESRDGAAYCPWCSMFADGCTCEFGQARAALDAEDGDGLTEVARISADADLYRKTDGVVIRREDGDE